jgi:hypothetical protein
MASQRSSHKVPTLPTEEPSRSGTNGIRTRETWFTPHAELSTSALISFRVGDAATEGTDG